MPATRSAVLPGVTTDLEGRPRILNGIVDMGAYEFIPVIPGDSDRHGNVDLNDSAAFQACASGPAVALAGDCAWAGFDRDADADQSDFGIFQRCCSGPNKPADPGCAE